MRKHPIITNNYFTIGCISWNGKTNLNDISNTLKTDVYTLEGKSFSDKYMYLTLESATMMLNIANHPKDGVLVQIINDPFNSLSDYIEKSYSYNKYMKQAKNPTLSNYNKQMNNYEFFGSTLRHFISSTTPMIVPEKCMSLSRLENGKNIIGGYTIYNGI